MAKMLVQANNMLMQVAMDVLATAMLATAMLAAIALLATTREARGQGTEEERPKNRQLSVKRFAPQTNSPLRSGSSEKNARDAAIIPR